MDETKEREERLSGVPAQAPNGSDQRNEFERDRDRVLYSSGFRRLAGVTQVAAVSELHLLHNRLTHSLKVAQLGRRFAEKHIRQDPALEDCLSADVVETAGLAHDLGHPPFGHAAEKVLDRQMKDYGGFEGNAQTFRIVARLAVRAKSKHGGLDLTRASLNAILKYPSCRGCRKVGQSGVGVEGFNEGTPWTDRRYGRKWGFYDLDYPTYRWAREPLPVAAGSNICGRPPASTPSQSRPSRTAESILMDWADDVSFATHDLEDYYRAGQIPLHDLESLRGDFLAQASAYLSETHGETFDVPRFSAAVSALINRIHEHKLTNPYSGTREERGRIRDFVSNVIADACGSIELTGTPSALQVRIKREMQYEIEALRYLTPYFVINRPGLATSQRGQEKLIENLFTELVEMLECGQGRDRYRLPPMLRELWDENEVVADGTDDSEGAVRARTACDFLCSLTEPQAVDLYGRLTAFNPSTSIFGAAW